MALSDREKTVAAAGVGVLAFAGTAGGSDPPDDGDGPQTTHTLSVSKYRDWHTAGYPDVPLSIGATDMVVESGPGQVENGSLNVTLTSSQQELVVSYDTLVSFDWSGGPIEVHRDGTRVDPYELSDGGPRYRWLGGEGSAVVEATIYETVRLRSRNGYDVTAAGLASWISGALKEKGVSHDILYSLPSISVPMNGPGCHDPLREGTDRDPAAYYVWNDMLNDTGYVEDFEDARNTNLHPQGDTFVQRKDSNLLGVDRRGGGCASVGGSASVAGVNQLTTLREYEHGTTSADSWGDSLHDAMHEMGHNLGFAHPGRQDCSLGGGFGYVDDQGRWNRTPCNPWNGCENRCGVWIPYRSDATSERVVRHLYFTDCTADHFRSEVGGEAGNAQAISLDAAESSACEACGVVSERGSASGGCGCSGGCSC